MKKRLFLISKKIDGRRVILGYVECDTFPSTLTRDQEKAFAMFGYEYLTITEISEHCHVIFE